jgi:Uma2 family endonuclease
MDRSAGDHAAVGREPLRSSRWGALRDPCAHVEAPGGWAEVKSLLLAVEVLSSSTARADRHRKRLIYQDEGVAEYWIIDPAARLVERWRPADTRPEQIVDTLVWQPDPSVPALQVDLLAYFRAVHDEAAASPPASVSRPAP